ncbi:AMP-binding protein [Streptomyces sp. NPDC087908]|uniref:AMP-binding protein n=1 Tax=Streptomyces sp. NPDC087908 TaxID=3365820 RepID=UPI00382557CE
MSHLWELFTEKVKGGRLALPALRPSPQEIPLQQLYEQAEETAVFVQSKMINNKPLKLGILMSNGEPWLRGFLAALRLNAAAVPLPLPVAFSGPESYSHHISRICRQANLSGILVDHSLGRHLRGRVKEAADSVPLIDIIEYSSVSGSLPQTFGNEDLAIIQYTSGSTSAPKGVALTHENVEAGLSTLATSLDWKDDDAWGVWVPLFHDMGLFTALTSLSCGASVSLWKPADAVRRPMQWLTEFAESTATALSAPNFFYDLLCSAAESEGVPTGLDISQWRIAANAAEPVQHRTMSNFRRLFAPHGLQESALRPSYGMAEATLLVSTPRSGRPWKSLNVNRQKLTIGDPVDTTPGAADRAVVSCGEPAYSTRIRITSETGEVYPELVSGEIQIAGPSVTHGYLDAPPEEQPFSSDGWLRTGDVGFLHEDELYITGRIKGMITVHGQNYYAEDVEEIIRSTPGAEYKRAAAIASVDGDKEEMIVLLESSFVSEQAENLSRSARDRVAYDLGLQQVKIVIVPNLTIPHTSSGKVQRTAAKLLYESTYRCTTKDRETQ